VVLCSHLLVCVLLSGVGAGMADADGVTLKNGDRITGAFVSVRGRNISLQTGALGTLTIPLGQVASVDVNEMVMAFTRAGQPRTGWLALGPAGNWQLTDGESGITRTIDASAIDVILPVARYQSIVEHAAGPFQDWTGTASLGYSIQRGNQRNDTLSSSVDTRRERPAAPIFERHWRTNVHMTLLLSNAEEDETSIGANTFSSSVRQDLLFAPGNFVFAIAQFDHVGTEGLFLRQTYGGGTGYDVTLRGRGTLSIFGGLTLVREEFSSGPVREELSTSGPDRTAQFLFGEKIRYQLTPRVRVDHATNLSLNITTVGQYHLDTRTALDVKLTNRFSLNTALIDLYLTNPGPGSQRNTFALTTGIGATF
jgi:putative salt-induced outer membrane protein YdiY